MKNFLFLLFWSLTFFSLESFSSLKTLPVQDGGRVKPFQSLARESLHMIYGRRSYEGKGAEEIVLSWLLVPEIWLEEEILQVSHGGLKKSLNLDSQKNHFSFQELFQNYRFGVLMRDLEDLRTKKEKLSSFYKAAERLEHQARILLAFTTGEALRVLPPEGDPLGVWISVKDLKGEYREAFSEILKGFLAYTKNPDEVHQIHEKAQAFVNLVQEKRGSGIWSPLALKVEVFYNKIQPFLGAWIFYILALIFLGFSFFSEKRFFRYIYIFLISFGFFLHTFGFFLRVYLTGRAPVTNMYETLMWMPWAAMLLALIFYNFYKSSLYLRKVFLLGAVGISSFCLILNFLAPVVLSDSLEPLEPVLRDNFWLTTHVLTIVFSYGALGLAWILGNLFLIFYIYRPSQAHLRDGAQMVYGVLKVGVVLLTLGLVLGGLWADYSWGRFWGWDPKETWALIALLVYIAILHGRLARVLKDFGTLISVVLAFSFVVMAWYGVNFILGVGLHSYGFGTGGAVPVGLCILLQWSFCLYVGVLHYFRKNSVD